MQDEKPMHVFKLNVKDDELIQENLGLRREFIILKDLTLQWFDEKAKMIDKI